MKETIIQKCEDKIKELNLGSQYQNRLKEELREIESQNEYEYFASLIGKNLPNENNLLVPYLLGICTEFDINKEPAYIYGEFPDIDIDYVPVVRNYLKEKFSREKFGEDYVCNIATYTTFGLRSSLIDMAKVFDLDRKEILALTTRLGIKDNEGEVLTWDKAVELYDDLREYLEKHPEMAEAAKKLLHRNRNMGMHASGLIISNVPIQDFVPCVKVKDGAGAASAWVEGLHGTDLGAVGLVKFDFLSLDANMKIATAAQLIKTEEQTANDIISSACQSVGKVCALPGKSSWTNTSYLNDPVAIEMANRGDLKMVFQYDGSEGIRKLARQGGVSSFDDLVAYTSLYRPSCLKLGMHEKYCDRKTGKEKYTIHPALSFLEKTYGVLVYQEQVMRILNVVGKIPLKDCEAVRKAISKKKIEKFKAYKEQFIQNGKQVLGCDDKEINDLWGNVESFSGYGFNACLSENTIIPTSKGMKMIKHFSPGDVVYSVNENEDTVDSTVVDLHDHGILEGYEVTFDDGYSVVCTLDHKFLTAWGQTPLWEIIQNNLDIRSDTKYAKSKEWWNNNTRNLVSRKIVRIVPVGKRQMYDIEVSCPTHNFLLPSGIVTSNSHATAYGYISSRMLYLKAHHPLAFYSSVITHTNCVGPADYLKLKTYKQEAEKHGIKFNRCDINKSGKDCRIHNGQIYYSFSKIRGIGEEMAKRMEELQPYTDYEDFVKRFGCDAKVNQAVIALRMFPDADPETLYRFYESYKAEERRSTERDKRFNKSITKYRERLREITGTDEIKEDLYATLSPETMVKVEEVIKNIIRCTLGYERKAIVMPTLKEFQYDLEIDADLLKLFRDKEAAEQEYYGFVWNHPIEKCKNYSPNNTIEDFETSQIAFGPIDIQLRKITKKKGPKASYYSAEVEDANGSSKFVTIWENDYKQFEELLVPGKFLRMQVSAPTGGFRNFTLFSPGRFKKIPKDQDRRVFSLD